MQNLKLSKQDRKECDTNVALGGKHKGPQYPYGFELRIENGMVEKLGLSDLDVEDVVSVMGVGKVVSKSVNEKEGGKKEQYLFIQIQKVDIGKDKDLKDRIKGKVAKEVYEDED